MKSVGAAAAKKAEAKADGAEASAEEAKPAENVDFSNVKIEPIFKEMLISIHLQSLISVQLRS